MTRFVRLVIVIWMTIAAVAGDSHAALTVSTDFEGGSAVVDMIDHVTHEVHVRPGGDPARGWPCWWYLRIDGLAQGQAATLVVRGSERPARNNGVDTGRPLASAWSLPDRATVSDDGEAWRHTPPGMRDAGRVAYPLVGTGGPLWVAWGPPFTSRECDELLRQAVARQPEHARVFELARSREGRPIRGVRVKSAAGKETLPAVWLQARQHAWESGSSWVARGFVEWSLGDDTEAIWLRAHADIVVIPVMDVDHVATGDGGKESDPHDHNRDWSTTPFYPEIAAAQRWLEALSADGRLALFLDLHNPAPDDRRPFFFVGPADGLSDAARAHRDRFLAFSARRLDAPLPLDPAPRVTGPAYHPLWRHKSDVWVDERTRTDAVAACLETAWNTPHSTTGGYREVGAKLGRAIADTLRLRHVDAE